MVRCKHYVIKGNPIAWARPGVSKGKFYDSQKQLKLLMGITLRSQHDDEPFFSGPIAMQFIYFMQIPESYTAKKKALVKNQWHFIKPDISNLIKLVEDCAIGILYKDDCIIAKEIVEKVYDDGQGERTEIIVYELKGKRVPHETYCNRCNPNGS